MNENERVPPRCTKVQRRRIFYNGGKIRDSNKTSEFEHFQMLNTAMSIFPAKQILEKRGKR